MKKIKVLIVEDSRLMQQIIAKILSSDPEIEVCGIVADPILARDLIKKTNPDVLTLDIMLPHMDGITFLKNLMRLRPMPVVVVSALIQTGNAIALEALALGAVDYLPKPTQKEIDNLGKYAKDMIKTVKNAAGANVARQMIPLAPDRKMEKILQKIDLLKDGIIAIGASTGGIEAIEKILLQLPTILPPIVIVQHIKKDFDEAFSNRIKKLYGLAIELASNYSELLPGHIYVAPGGMHLVIKKGRHHYFSRLSDEPPVSNHKPSINMLFESAAIAAGKDCIGVLLTGMGSDGAEGLKAIQDAGGATIAQDEESSVVWGMPAAAIKMKAVDFIVSLEKIPIKILQIIDKKALTDPKTG